jgi:hypothetical protein
MERGLTRGSIVRERERRRPISGDDEVMGTRRRSLTRWAVSAGSPHVNSHKLRTCDRRVEWQSLIRRPFRA